MVRPAGFEPATFWFEARHSNPLSYGRTIDVYYRIREGKDTVVIRNLHEAEVALRPYVPLVKELTGKDTTLERMVPLMAHIGNPHERLKVVHVAGTSGKTSTAYFVASLLGVAGKRVGLTVSPHIDSITERVQIEGCPLSEDAFCRQLDEFLGLVKTAPVEPSYFELLCAFALWVFEREGVDYAVVETGLGGLYDATNVVCSPNKVCVLTDIGFDHMNLLGTSLEAIATQKIGIVHPGNVAITYQQTTDVMRVFRKQAGLQQVNLQIVSSSGIPALTSGLPAYQLRNWGLAWHTYNYLQHRDSLPKLTDEQLEVTQQVTVPGRMDVIHENDKTVIMDGAHNVQKMTAFIESFRAQYPGVRPAVLVAMKTGKEYREVVPLLADFSDDIIVTTFHVAQDLTHESMDAATLAEALKEAGVKRVSTVSDQTVAYQKLLSLSQSILVVTGSFYLLSQLRKKIS